MALNYTTANMSLIIPVPGEETGPTWATDINTSLTIVDGHTHSPGSGVQITPSGLNINADLNFQTTNNAVALRSVRFTTQSTPLSRTTDVGVLYESGSDLYYNDGSGNQIRLTQGGAVAGSVGTITGLPSGTASAAYVSGTGTFLFQQATSTAANLDIGSIAVRYPGSYPTPTGNYIQLEAPAALASGYTLSLPPLPVANNTFLTSSTAGAISAAVALDNASLVLTTNTINVPNGGITLTKLAAPNLLYGINSVGASTSSGSYVDVTGATATITTVGRPVMITMFAQDPTGGAKFLINRSGGTTEVTAYFRILRGVTDIGGHFIGAQGNAGGTERIDIALGQLVWIDVPAAGTYTYKLQIRSGTTTQLILTTGAISVYEF